MASYVTAKKNTAWIGYIRLSPRAGIGTFQNNPTLASGDVKVSIDGGALANLTTLPVVTPASSDWVKVSLSASEMNGDNIAVQFKDAAGNEWCDDGFLIQTSARKIDDLAYPATSGRSIVVDASGLVDANVVKLGPSGSGTAQTARDVGASVLLSSGTGTGQVSLSSGQVTVSGFAAATGLSAVRSGTAQAGAVGQITLDAGASSVDNFYRGLGCYIVSGTGSGQVGIIYGYTGSTKVALISPQWRTAPDATSVFALQPTPGANVEMWRTAQANVTQSGRPDVYVGATAAGAITNSSFASGAIDATAIATDAITSAELATSAATKIRDTILSDSTAFAGASIAAIKAKTDNLPASPAATSDVPTANQNADALLDRADGVETGYTLRQWLRLAGSVLLGKASGLATTTAVYRDLGDTKDRITATVDTNGNRTAITRDAT